MGSVEEVEENVVEVSDLEFAYGGQAPFISKFSLKLKRGSRCLLIGANGAGELEFRFWIAFYCNGVSINLHPILSTDSCNFVEVRSKLGFYL